MVRLNSLRLAGWKSIRDMDPALELRDLNVFIGANGAGKSNLIEFFRCLRELIEGRLQEYVARAGGADALLHYGVKQTQTIEADLNFVSDQHAVNHFLVRLVSTATNGLTFRGERIDQGITPSTTNGPLPIPSPYDPALLLRLAEQGNPIATSIRDLLLGCRVFHFHDTSTTSPMRRECYIEANRHLDADGGNLAALLYRYRQMQPVVYRRILGAIRQIAPFLDDFILEPRELNPRQILLNWRAKGQEHLFGPHQLSDGTLRVIALCTLLLQPVKELPPVVILDEPELGLHPAALNIVAGLLKAASVHTQIVLATQSARLLDHFALDQIVVVEQRDGGSRFHRLDEAAYHSWLKEYTLSDLWERNVIGGGPYA
jgi:predicted ATPase